MIPKVGKEFTSGSLWLKAKGWRRRMVLGNLPFHEPRFVPMSCRLISYSFAAALALQWTQDSTGAPEWLVHAMGEIKPGDTALLLKRESAQ